MERVRVFRQGREPIEHDPAAQRFGLVIPHAARGREGSERAKLLDVLLKERDPDVPDYVRSFVVVYGREGLLECLDALETMEVRVAELEPLHQPPLPASRCSPTANLLPPAEFWTHSGDELALRIDDEELWAFGYVGGDEYDAFEEAGSDLLIQLEMEHPLPICVLALADCQTHRVRRAYLDPESLADRQARGPSAARSFRGGYRGVPPGTATRRAGRPSVRA